MSKLDNHLEPIDTWGLERRHLDLAEAPAPRTSRLVQAYVLNLIDWIKEQGHNPEGGYIRRLTLIKDGRLYVTFSEEPRHHE